MNNQYFQFSRDGINWLTNLPVPSALNGDAEDLDDDSYRSALTGNVIRKIVDYKWEKISFEFKGLDDDQARELLAILRTANNVYIRTNSPVATGSIKGYVSKVHFEYIHTGSNKGVWTISFNFIEGVR